jgi:hypothetical protein
MAHAQIPRPPLPAGTVAHRDLTYVENGHERHKLDLFVPEKADAPLPLIIWVHGGGWQNGSKDGGPPLRNGYTERGYAVASINYRLSGHATFPAQIEDCKAAIRWLRAHAAEYRLDARRFGVWGSSAGGHLVALLGTSGEVKEFDVGAHLDQSSRVQAVCDYYGPMDFTVFVTKPGAETNPYRFVAFNQRTPSRRSRSQRLTLTSTAICHLRRECGESAPRKDVSRTREQDAGSGQATPRCLRAQHGRIRHHRTRGDGDGVAESRRHLGQWCRAT